MVKYNVSIIADEIFDLPVYPKNQPIEGVDLLIVLPQDNDNIIQLVDNKESPLLSSIFDVLSISETKSINISLSGFSENLNMNITADINYEISKESYEVVIQEGKLNYILTLFLKKGVV